MKNRFNIGDTVRVTEGGREGTILCMQKYITDSGMETIIYNMGTYRSYLEINLTLVKRDERDELLPQEINKELDHA